MKTTYPAGRLSKSRIGYLGQILVVLITLSFPV